MLSKKDQDLLESTVKIPEWEISFASGTIAFQFIGNLEGDHCIELATDEMNNISDVVEEVRNYAIDLNPHYDVRIWTDEFGKGLRGAPDADELYRIEKAFKQKAYILSFDIAHIEDPYQTFDRGIGAYHLAAEPTEMFQVIEFFKNGLGLDILCRAESEFFVDGYGRTLHALTWKTSVFDDKELSRFERVWEVLSCMRRDFSLRLILASYHLNQA